ncbi:hypothetical protein CP979_36085 [Streptomyces filamentosus]|nr:hypothetical protein CP979_36085 [Streptomyces filamentosus]
MCFGGCRQRGREVVAECGGALKLQLQQYGSGRAGEADDELSSSRGGRREAQRSGVGSAAMLGSVYGQSSVWRGWQRGRRKSRAGGSFGCRQQGLDAQRACRGCARLSVVWRAAVRAASGSGTLLHAVQVM